MSAVIITVRMRLFSLILLLASIAAPGIGAPAFVFTKVDLKLLDESKAIDRELETRGLVFHDAAVDAHLTAVGRSVIPPGDLEHVEWQFHVLRDPMVNAFALPNGSIYVNAGLLARAENDDQIAGVLAHEATHVAHRHGYLTNRSIRRKSFLLNAASWITWIPAGGVAGQVISWSASVGQVAVVLSVYGYSRELEQEADVSGLDLLKRAGRRPDQLARMMFLFDDKLEPEPVPILYNDHPRTKQRIDYLRQKLGMPDDLPAAEDRAYVLAMKTVIAQAVQLQIDGRRFRSAVAAATKLAAAQPDDSANLFLSGEAWRSLGPRRPRLSERELTNSGLRAGYKASRKLTEDEEVRQLTATEEGRAALQENRAKAEDFYRRAAALDPSAANPYLGLGALYQDAGRTADAIAAYRKCLELSPSASDRDRVERRLAALSAPGGAKRRPAARLPSFSDSVCSERRSPTHSGRTFSRN
jgi:predicted Zn-dependent protease